MLFWTDFGLRRPEFRRMEGGGGGGKNQRNAAASTYCYRQQRQRCCNTSSIPLMVHVGSGTSAVVTYCGEIRKLFSLNHSYDLYKASGKVT